MLAQLVWFLSALGAKIINSLDFIKYFLLGQESKIKHAMFFAFSRRRSSRVKSLLNLRESMYVLCHYLSSFQRKKLHECEGPHIGALNSWRPQGSDKEQHKARVKGHTLNPGAPVDSHALLLVHTTNIVYGHRLTWTETSPLATQPH